MQDFKERIGHIVRKQRKKLGITQEKLAEIIGVTTGSIGQYERGETMPSVETLKLLLNYLRIDPREVFVSEYEIDADYVKLLYVFKQMTPVKQQFMLDFAQFLVNCEYVENVCDIENV